MLQRRRSRDGALRPDDIPFSLNGFMTGGQSVLEQENLEKMREIRKIEFCSCEFTW